MQSVAATPTQASLFMPTEHGARVAPESALRFALAGKSTFTLRSAKSGRHYTYQVRAMKDEQGNETGAYFVSLLVDSDTFAYLGVIRADGKLTLTAKSRMTWSAPSVQALDWALRHAMQHESLEVWHEGRCGKCGRRLTHPTSIEIGLGPECRGDA